MAVQLSGGGLLRVPMQREKYLALGETRHAEWFDGLCVVSPPTRLHQIIEVRLARLLGDAVPSDLLVLHEWGWRTAEGEFEPDVVVFAADDPGPEVLMVPPRLVVEILSTSNRRADLVRKRDLYGRGGLPWYWVVDPDEAEVVVFRADAGHFVEAQRVRRGEAALAVGPYRVELAPERLVADRGR
jgi:Uma2 family endonuclease